jgi:hypothetical protein
VTIRASAVLSASAAAEGARATTTIEKARACFTVAVWIGDDTLPSIGTISRIGVAIIVGFLDRADRYVLSTTTATGTRTCLAALAATGGEFRSERGIGTIIARRIIHGLSRTASAYGNGFICREQRTSANVFTATCASGRCAASPTRASSAHQIDFYVCGCPARRNRPSTRRKKFLYIEILDRWRKYNCAHATPSRTVMK